MTENQCGWAHAEFTKHNRKNTVQKCQTIRKSVRAVDKKQDISLLWPNLVKWNRQHHPCSKFQSTCSHFPDNKIGASRHLGLLPIMGFIQSRKPHPSQRVWLARLGAHQR